MLPNCAEYKRRLMRLKTLGQDCRFAHAALQSSERKPGAGGAGVVLTAQTSSKERLTGTRLSIRRKYDSSELWMRQPHRRRRSRHLSRQRRPPQEQLQLHQSSPVSQRLAATDLETETCRDEQTSRLDLQTNNSRKPSGGGGCAIAMNNANSARTGAVEEDLGDFLEDSSVESEPEFLNSNAGSSEEISNENAVAKGANALVKQATSRQTEIIDTSKLLEEGRVETQYEEPEDEPEEIEETDHNLIDEYEKTFAFARRLRSLLNMKFKVMDRGSIETNFLMVKAHEHPTQKVTDRWRNDDLGDPYDSQIRQQKLVDDFKQTLAQKKAPKKGEVRIPVYPGWIKFYVRFKKDSAEKRWEDYCAYKQRMKKASGGKVAVPKATDRYLPAFYDVWTTSLVVFAKPETTMLDVIDPVFAKLGLEARADFKFTIGCFIGDKRAGKAKVPGAPADAEELTMQVLCADLYKRNCNEIFVNDNRIEMFQTFPAFYDVNGGRSTGDDNSEAKADKKGKKGKKDKKDAKGEKSGADAKSDSVQNQSNADSESQATLPAKLKPLKQFRRRAATDTSESRHGDSSVGKLTIPEEATVSDQLDSSPSATNGNLSVHDDCDSSDACESQPTLEGANSTTKSGRTETTKRESD